MKLWIRDDLRAPFAGLDFEDFLTLGQHSVRVGPDGTRRTAWFERAGRRYYLKVHGGIGWRELAKAWLQGKRPVVDARPEAHALARLAQLALPAPRLAAYGWRGLSPARRRSFVLTEALVDTEDLGECLAREGAPAPRERQALARALGRLVGRLHAARLAHRDLYLTHVRRRRTADGHFELFLIDLHRAARARAGSRRWRLKDLGALRFSGLALPITRSDCARFLAAYGEHVADASPRARRRAWLRRIEARAHAVRRRLAARAGFDA